MPLLTEKKQINAFWQITLLIIILSATGLLRLFDKGCLPEHDCESYIAMAHSIAPDSSILPHHAMRILPSLIARGIHYLGFSLHDSFLLIVTASTLATFCLLYRLCLKISRDPLLSFTASLALFVWNWGMLIPLKTPYQACDALVYLFIIATVYCMRGKQIWPLFIISILGVLTRQSCFVLAFFATAQLFWITRRPLVIVQFAMIMMTYGALTYLYQSSDVLMRVVSPNAQHLTLNFWRHFILDSRFFFILLPFIPWVFIGKHGLLSALQKDWYLFFYSLVVSLQPIVSYDLTGYHNFVRISLQGIWAIALVTLLHTIQQPLSREQKMTLVLYTTALTIIWVDIGRLWLTLAAFGYLTWLHRRHIGYQTV